MAEGRQPLSNVNLFLDSEIAQEVTPSGEERFQWQQQQPLQPPPPGVTNPSRTSTPGNPGPPPTPTWRSHEFHDGYQPPRFIWREQDPSEVLQAVLRPLSIHALPPEPYHQRALAYTIYAGENYTVPAFHLRDIHPGVHIYLGEGFTGHIIQHPDCGTKSPTVLESSFYRVTTDRGLVIRIRNKDPNPCEVKRKHPLALLYVQRCAAVRFVTEFPQGMDPNPTFRRLPGLYQTGTGHYHGGATEAGGEEFNPVGGMEPYDIGPPISVFYPHRATEEVPNLNRMRAVHPRLFGPAASWPSCQVNNNIYVPPAQMAALPPPWPLPEEPGQVDGDNRHWRRSRRDSNRSGHCSAAGWDNGNAPASPARRPLSIDFPPPSYDTGPWGGQTRNRDADVPVLSPPAVTPPPPTPESLTTAPLIPAAALDGRRHRRPWRQAPAPPISNDHAGNIEPNRARPF